MKYKESNILIIISTLRKIIAIFFGPFLTAYFIKASTDSLLNLSLYNIMNYIVLGIGGIITGYIIRNKFQIGIFRIGIISSFIYILMIIILKEKMIMHLPLLSFLYGFSTITYFYPHNLFMSSKIKNSERVEYEFKRKTVSTIIAILIPVILGSLITTTNFELTAIMILFISLIQIVLSFFIKPIENKNYKFTPIISLKKLLKNKDVKNTLIADYFKGFNISEGALEVVTTVLIFNAFKTDLNLGILTSMSSTITIIIQYIYTKFFKTKKDNKLILLCAIVPVISLVLLLIHTNNITLIIYYLCYTTFVNILLFMVDIRLFNISNLDIVKKDNVLEFWSIREVILNLGRITSYILLLVVAVTNPDKYLSFLMIFLITTIVLMGHFSSKVEKFDDIT